MSHQYEENTSKTGEKTQKKKKIREKIYMGRKLKLLEKVIVLWKQCQHLS